ncbi:DUF1090 family protein [Helicobacter cappadocius]|uniref:DUF1090 family protein n=1 Tax=Helicobacter cappadocius TaxID=3063998 RepID=A0AA90T5E1_9HELI|nr:MULTISPECIES: DUF1090 family protein [unclassified Helicobacter]MDO7253418.1 DUF1090 family protein [Helicobacter sp. faydin-H75]MDP2539318.1 DUF1090 family protein [Helicobacter sp. faydin-H76]
MVKILLVSAVLGGIVYAGPVCDFKLNDLKSQIDYAKKKGFEDKAKQLEVKLSDFSKTCRDSDILEEINQNIKNTQKNLQSARSALHQAQIDGNAHNLRQAQIDYKVANMQYIAAKQEMLRMKDLIKSSGNKK